MVSCSVFCFHLVSSHLACSSSREGRCAASASNFLPALRSFWSSDRLSSQLWGRKVPVLVARSRPAPPKEEYGRMRKQFTARSQGIDGLTSLAVAVGVPLVLGVANAFVNNPNTDFYKNLKKPSFNPPNWLFGVAWGVLYPVMGLASWLVWSEGGFRKQAVPLATYAVQLAFNLLWPPIFFSAHNIRLAFADLLALVVAVAATIVLFRPVNPLSAYLLIPYLAWVSFAAFLNYNYVTLNPSTAVSSQTT